MILTCAGLASDRRSNAAADRETPHPHTCYTPASSSPSRRRRSSNHDSHTSRTEAAWPPRRTASLPYLQFALLNRHGYSSPFLSPLHTNSDHQPLGYTTRLYNQAHAAAGSECSSLSLISTALQLHTGVIQRLHATIIITERLFLLVETWKRLRILYSFQAADNMIVPREPASKLLRC